MPGPTTTHHRDLPIVSTMSFDDVGTVRAALTDLERGMFLRPAQLCDALVGDDRIEGILETRVDALFSLPLEITPHGDGRRSQMVADDVRENWERRFPQEELKKLLRWGLLLKVAPAQKLWRREARRWDFRLKVWDLRYVYWIWNGLEGGGRFMSSSADGLVELEPGSPEWLLYTPNGFQRGWIYGLVRPLARLFLMRQWGMRDWARESEIHGIPIRKAITPSSADKKARDSFMRDVLNLGNEAVIETERDDQNHGFDVELVEAAAQSWEGFQKLLEKVEESAAVAVLGQNLTTSMKSGGSYAAANVHDRIRQDRLEADAKSLAPALREQVLCPWAEANYGDRELAPVISWSTKAPEDRAAMAKMLNDLGNGLTNLRKAGLNVDLEQVAAQFRVPLVKGEPVIEPEPENETEQEEAVEQEEPKEEPAESEKPND